MFRVILIKSNNDEILHPEHFNTEADAEGVAKEELAAVASKYTVARILRPIAELLPVTTIQRRPLVNTGGN